MTIESTRSITMESKRSITCMESTSSSTFVIHMHCSVPINVIWRFKITCKKNVHALHLQYLLTIQRLQMHYEVFPQHFFFTKSIN